MSEVWCARATRELTRQVLLALSARHVSPLKRLERSRRGSGCFPSTITEMETMKKRESREDERGVGVTRRSLEVGRAE